MSVERRLADLSIKRQQETAQLFLVHHGEPWCRELRRLQACEVTGYVVGEAEHLSVASTGLLASALRDFVRFLYATGVVPRDLSGAIPGVASARLASLPKALDQAVVTRLLGSCDRRRPGGLRDFAILTLLARLGLRAIEVSSMRLDDLDWRAGEFLVRGKGQRRDRMPIPVEVGEALADYLAKGRQSSDSRAVFLRSMAPAGPISRNAVVLVSRSASKRAGLPMVGAHRLRHTVATEMLAHGASLREIAGVLRHESEQTTAIYAKVARASLDLAVRPWPVAP
jgi:integrase/recombinase XerD